MTHVDARVDGIRAALTAEYAAVYGYGVVGAHLRGAALAEASRALAWHQGREALLRAALSARGAEVPAPEAAYVLPFPVSSAVTAARLATALEEGVGTVYANLVADGEGGDRQDAAVALGQCALRAAQWRGFSVPFPGLPERAASG